MEDLIKLKNSNALNKYPVDAEQLNFNFQQILSMSGAGPLKDLIESTGQIYSTTQPDQLARAITQLISSAYLFKANITSTPNKYILLPYTAGYAEPYALTPGMRVSFVASATNTDAATIRFSTMTDEYVCALKKDNSELQPGVITPGIMYTMLFVSDSAASSGGYWNIIDASSESGESDTSLLDSLLTLVRYVISTAGLEYSTTDITLLGKAVENYLCNSLYDNTYNNGTYTLMPFGYKPAIQTYTNGTMLSFIPASDNTITNPSIKIGSLDPVQILDYNGKPLPLYTLRSGSLVTVHYLDGNFYLINQYLPRLVLSNDVAVTTISNDNELSNASSSALVTESAVKNYVDVKVKSAQSNIIISGYTNALGQPAAMHAVGDHCIEIISDVDTDTNYSYYNVTPSNKAAVSSSTGNTSTTLLNPIANVQKIGDDPEEDPTLRRISTLYWSCNKACQNGAPVGGFAIDGCQRKYENGVVTRIVNEDTSTNLIHPYVMVSDFDYSYYELALGDNLTGATSIFPDILKIQHTRGNTTPEEIKVQVQLEHLGAWYDIVDNTSIAEPGGEQDVYRWNVPGSTALYFTASSEPTIGTLLYLNAELTEQSTYTISAITDPDPLNYTYVATNTNAETITCGDRVQVHTTLPPQYSILYTYGQLAMLSPDENSIYTIDLTGKLWDPENKVLYSGTSRDNLIASATKLDVRICATYFPHQEYTAQDYASDVPVFTGQRAQGYTARTPWEISKVQLYKRIDKAKSFTIAYPSQNLETFKTNKVFSLYVQKYTTSGGVDVPDNEVECLDFGPNPDGTNITQMVMYKEYGSDTFTVVPKDLIYIQSYRPQANATNSGAVWFDITETPYKSYVCTYDDSLATPDYVWRETDCILLGGLTITRTTTGTPPTEIFEDTSLSDIIQYRYGKIYVSHNRVDALTDQTITLHHNFGFDVTLEAYLRCVVPEAGYSKNDYISLAPGRTEIASLSANTSTVTIDGVTYTFLTSSTELTKDVSYFTLIDNMELVIARYSNLKILHKTNNTYVPISANNWDLCIFITKD